MKKPSDENSNNEPDWLDPNRDRSTPYTDTEIDEFVDGYIQGHPREYAELLTNDGPNTARVILRNRFRAWIDSAEGLGGRH